MVEVPCEVDSAGPRPLPLAPLDGHQLGLVQSVKAVETTTIEAALTGSRRLALRALATHPLVDSVTRARAILDAELADVRAPRGFPGTCETRTDHGWPGEWDGVPAGSGEAPDLHPGRLACLQRGAEAVGGHRGGEVEQHGRVEPGPAASSAVARTQ